MPDENKRKRSFFLFDIIKYSRKSGKWWMIPVVIMLFLAGILIIASGSALSPLLYALV